MDKVCSSGGGIVIADGYIVYGRKKKKATKPDPFEGVYERAPPSLKNHLPEDFVIVAVAEEFWNREEVLWQLKYKLDRALKRMTNSANKKRVGVQGRRVRLRPHRQKSLNLAAMYFGPFQIIRRVGVVAYELRLLDNAKIQSKVKGDHRDLVELSAELIWEE
ncbi:LOW QUALITY PROTEIN: hypothetical protein V2J09_023079 [Rumex salicifolius]